MNYPLISEYIEAIKSAEDNFQELAHLRAVLGNDGQPVMTSGNFSVVFKMKDEETGKLYALKCFTKEQEGQAYYIDKKVFVIKLGNAHTFYLHRSTWGEYSMDQFNKGQMVKVQKIGFDDKHKKHIWKIVSVYWPMASSLEETVH